jgi:hypothetical protein
MYSVICSAMPIFNYSKQMMTNTDIFSVITARGFVYVLDAFFKTNVTSYITKSLFTVLLTR